MGNLINIAFQGGTHGNYLRFFIEKFSTLTPEIKDLPFTKIGTSHKEIKYSNKVNIYHPSEHNDNFINVDEPHVLITISNDDLLYYQRLVFIRPSDQNLKTNEDNIVLTEKFWGRNINGKFLEANDNHINSFKELYNCKDVPTIVPVFIFRDYIKLLWLSDDDHYYIKRNKLYQKNKPAQCFELPVSTFHDTKKFIKTIIELSQQFNLEIKIDQSAYDIHELFLKNLTNFETKDRMKDILDCIKNKKLYNLNNVDIIEQSYINAWVEKNYEFITMPHSKSYFKNTLEICEYIDWFPHHYKAMNPNLPTFNGRPNPFYLHNKTK